MVGTYLIVTRCLVPTYIPGSKVGYLLYLVVRWVTVPNGKAGYGIYLCNGKEGCARYLVLRHFTGPNGEVVLGTWCKGILRDLMVRWC